MAYPLRSLQRVGSFLALVQRLSLKLCDSLGASLPCIHYEQRMSAVVVAPTTPWPIARMVHQFLFYGIRMHVVKLLDHFLLEKDIEIEIASVPEPALLVLGVVESQPQLCRGTAFPSSHPARHALFEDLQSPWRSARQSAR